MKNKKYELFGLFLVIVMVVGTIVGVLPVSADINAWSEVTLPPGITVLEDVYVTPDSTNTYLVGNNGTSTSVWRLFQGSWSNIFTRNNTNGYIVRGAPDSNDVVYVADIGTTMMWNTRNGGGRWYLRAAPGNIQDLAVESTYVIYEATTDGVVNKSTNGGFTWSTGVDLGNPCTLTSLSTNDVVFGSSDGQVVFSNDGNVTWTVIVPKVYSGALLTQVTATGLNTGDYIFAASSTAGGGIRRWQIGTSTNWTDMSANSSLVGLSVYGIKLYDGGLYVLGSNGTDSEILECLNPTDSTPVWTELINNNEVMNDIPQGLQVSGGNVTIQAISTGNNTLQSYTIQ